MWFRTLRAVSRKNTSRPKRRGKRRLSFESLDSRRLLAFSPFSEFPAGQSPTLQVAGDFTGDGRQDLIVSSTGLELLRGDGAGVFQAPVTIASLQGPTATTSVVAGDLNGDGKLDLVTNNNIRMGNGDGSFQSPIFINLPNQVPEGYHSPTQQYSSSAVVGDLNNDGKLDIVVTGRTWATEFYYGPYFHIYTSGHVNVLLGHGDGTLAAAVVSPFSQQTWAEELALADLNHDGDLDMVVTRNDSFQSSFLVGNGDGSFAPYTYVPSGQGFSKALIGDFDEDGNFDLVTRGVGGDLRINQGRSDGGFEPPTDINPDQSADIPRSAAVGDINADGHLDIVFTSQQGYDLSYYGYGLVRDKVKVIFGRGDGTFTGASTSVLGIHDGLYNDVHSSLLGDWNGDGRLDVALVDRHLGILTVALNDGDSQAPPVFAIDDVSIVEGDGGTKTATFTVSLDRAPAGDVTVRYATEDATAAAGADYAYTTGMLTFSASVTRRTIAVPILGDVSDEFGETFALTLYGAVGAEIVDGVGVGSIINDDPPPGISIGDVSQSEGNQGDKLFDFTVTLSAPSGRNVLVSFATGEGTAKATSGDYRANRGAVVFEPGEKTRTVSIAVRGDKTSEADETFYVNLSRPESAVILDGQGQATILSDDAAPTPPAMRIADASIVEGNSGTRLMLFTVRLSKVSDGPVTVSYATRNGTAKLANKDYVATSGQLQFAPGEQTKMIAVTIRGDRGREADEHFFVDLFDVSGAILADHTGRGTITNDDG